jgi:hypothetical protein
LRARKPEHKRACMHALEAAFIISRLNVERSLKSVHACTLNHGNTIVIVGFLMCCKCVANKELQRIVVTRLLLWRC